MAAILSSMGQSIGSDLTSFGQNVQNAASGNMMPLMGDMMPKPIKGLMDTITQKNDPTKDPYKPDQPVVYDADGSLKKPEPSPYAGLLSTMSAPPDRKLNLIDNQMPAPMPPVVRTVQTSQSDPSKKLRQQAYGTYL